MGINISITVFEIKDNFVASNFIEKLLGKFSLELKEMEGDFRKIEACNILYENDFSWPEKYLAVSYTTIVR